MRAAVAGAVACGNRGHGGPGRTRVALLPRSSPRRAVEGAGSGQSFQASPAREGARTLGLVLVAFAVLAACGPGLGNRGGRSASESPAEGSFGRAGWKTDFSRHSVPLNEINSGGPPRDGIPPIDHPTFVSATDADSWLKPREPVISLDLDGQRRAYPLQILIWHEIVNDKVGSRPVTVTFCPLCNTAIAFDRRLDGRTLDFGTSGNLRRSDLVMWDRQTESWWQQVTGEAIVGELTGKRLEMLPAQIVSWQSFKDGPAGGVVLSRETGFSRSYGQNPYVGYDDAKTPPLFFAGPIDGRLPPKEHIVAVAVNGEEVAYPYTILRERRAVTDVVGGVPVAVFFQPGAAAATDGFTLADSRDIGSTGVFKREVNGRALSFRGEGSGFRDAETGSRWDILGHAVSGPLSGSRLEPVVHGDHFWFAWVVFRPKTRVYT